MPRWLLRALRMCVIGFGVSLTLLAGINLWAVQALFDVSVEQQLGLTVAEVRPIFYALGTAGLLIALVGALLPVPKAILAKEDR